MTNIDALLSILQACSTVKGNCTRKCMTSCSNKCCGNASLTYQGYCKQEQSCQCVEEDGIQRHLGCPLLAAPSP